MIQTGSCYVMGEDGEIYIAKTYVFENDEVRTAYIKIVESPYDDDREPLENEWLLVS
jgi:hypothetical protein